MESGKPKVVITGISGFLGSHICKTFLEDQGFSVRGTVRSKNNAKKINPLKKAYGSNYEKLEIVEADLLDKNSIFKAVEGCDYVIHTASPFPNAPPKDENTIIRPAVEGTLAVLQAAHKYKVKRVVLTSSITSIFNRKPANRKKIYNEQDWSDIEVCGANEKSKLLAEKAAYDFVGRLPESERFELVSLCCAIMMGPNLVESEFTSGYVVKRLMSENLPGLAKIMITIVDVREVAYAHLQAIKVKEAANQRIVLANTIVWIKQMAEMLKAEFGKYYRIPTSDLNYITFKMASFVDGTVKIMIPYWGLEYEFENDKSKKILGIKYRPLKDTLNEMAYKLIDTGFINNKLPKAKL